MGTLNPDVHGVDVQTSEPILENVSQRSRYKFVANIKKPNNQKI
jgi:hypothetical protein